ncbi:hypothetical protein, partial [Bilophila wadsworthia]
LSPKSNPYSQVVRLSVCRSLDLVAGAGGMLWLIGRRGCWLTMKHGAYDRNFLSVFRKKGRVCWLGKPHEGDFSFEIFPHFYYISL